MTRFDIEIYADTACPWSYVGKTYLDQAIETWRVAHPDAEFAIAWKPFYLIPTSKPSEKTYNRQQLYESYLGPTRASSFFKNVDSAATSLGLTIDLNGDTGNTHASHRLIRLARTQDEAASPYDGATQERLLSAMFRGQFEAGEVVSNHGFLAALAVEAGVAVDETEARGLLRDDGPLAEVVDRDARHAREIGISATPTFVVQGKYRVGGCQESGVFLALFEKILAAEGSV